ncbi:MAG: hypothetical protein AB1576_01795 [Bacillota bacterium]
MKLLLLLALILVSLPAVAAPAQHGRTLIFLLDHASWEDLEASPGFFEAGSLGSVGLLHTGSVSRSDGYATLGAGRRVRDARSGEAYQATEIVEGTSVSRVWLRRGGLTRGPGAIYNLGLWGMRRQSALEASIGALGQALSEAGVEARIATNLDIPGSPWRPAVSVIMDSEGVVTEGLVTPDLLLEEDPLSPYGLRDRLESYKEVWQALPPTGVAVLAPGDTHRAEMYRKNTSDRQADTLRRAAVERSLNLFYALVKDMDATRDLAILAVPTPSHEATQASSSLTPILVTGRGFSPGLLTSPSTRRPGVVLSTDIAPTVLRLHGVRVPGEMTGWPMGSVPHADALLTIRELELGILKNHGQRLALLRTYITGQIIILTAGAVWLFRPFGRQAVIQTGLLALTLVPLAFLVIPPLGIQGAPAFVVGFGLPVVAALVLGCLGIQRYHQYGIPAVFTAALLVADQLGGFSWTVDTPLGHSTVGGARFFGLGNEYAGLLIGATLVGLTALLGPVKTKRRTLFLLSAFIMVALAMGSPAHGANFGGALSATFAFSITFLWLWGIRAHGGRAYLLALGAVAAALAFLVVVDLLPSPEQRSHIGTAVARLVEEGPGYAWEVYSGKMNMNLRLIRYTIWSRVFITSLVSLAIALRVPRGVFAKLAARQPSLMVGIKGATLGSLFALAANDSGVVAAATAMVFASTTILALAMDEAHERPKEN